MRYEVRNFRDLQVWRKAHQLALDVYAATRGFPREEQYGLTNQIRRCAVSVPSNIAEGCGRGGDPELDHYLRIARGSASELEYQLLLARDLSLLTEAEYGRLSSQVVEIERMVVGYRQWLNGDKQKANSTTTN